jgi:hypothetical protein
VRIHGTGLYGARDRLIRVSFIATLWAVAGWLFFLCLGGSLRIDSDMLVVSASAARTALKNSQLSPRPRDQSHAIYGTGH